MKLLFAGTGIVSMMAVSLPAMAQGDRETPLLDAGTKELSVAGRIDIPDLDEIDYDLDGSFGYFFRDGWEVGARIGAADFGGRDRIELGAFTEYNFMRDSQWVPFVGGGLGLVSADFDDDLTIGTPLDDDDGVTIDVEGGVKYFLRPYMAISASVNFKVASEDIFETDEAIEDSLSRIKIGMRYYF